MHPRSVRGVRCVLVEEPPRATAQPPWPARRARHRARRPPTGAARCRGRVPDARRRTDESSPLPRHPIDGVDHRPAAGGRSARRRRRSPPARALPMPAATHRRRRRPWRRSTGRCRRQRSDGRSGAVRRLVTTARPSALQPVDHQDDVRRLRGCASRPARPWRRRHPPRPAPAASLTPSPTMIVAPWRRSSPNGIDLLGGAAFGDDLIDPDHGAHRLRRVRSGPPSP